MEYSAENLAGKSGTFRLEISIRQNSDCEASFFDNYALQMSLSLDTEKCSAITAENATKANVGQNEQLSYIILPGNEKDFTITAQVQDFEMDGISINGLPLDVDVDVDLSDNEEFQDKMQEIKDAASDFDDAAGTSDLSDGASELKDGSYELSDGVDSLADGVVTLSDGVDDLTDGSQTLSDGAKSVYDGTLVLDDGTRELLAGTETLSDGADDLYDGAKSLQSGLSTLTSQNSNLQTISNLLFAQALGSYTQNGLNIEPYAISQDTTLSQLSAMMSARQSELVSDDAKTTATQSAIQTRMGELGELASAVDTDAVGRLQYWYAALYYQALQAGNDEAAALGETLTDYQKVNGSYDENNPTVMQTAYQALSAAYSAEENAAVETAVTAALTERVSSDAQYQLLAAMSYYKGVLAYTDGVSSVASGAASLASGASGLKDGADSLHDAVESMKDGTSTLADGAEELRDGTAELYDNILILRSGVNNLQDGILDLEDGVASLLDGAIELYDGTIQLHDGVLQLKSGTMRFKDKTANINQEMQDRIQEAVEDLLGGNFDVTSFVDFRNTDTEFVQFVIQTPKIAVDDLEEETVEAPELTLWQKLLALFGL